MDKNKQQIINPGLYLVSTPIGNMEDITIRALNILKRSDIILCEDTRHSGKLLFSFQIKSKLLSYHKFNENKVSHKIINFLKEGKIISLISDAGTPTISDPGMILVNKCIEENLNVYPIPGPSAVTSALSVSGFDGRFIFYGFLAKKEKELENIFKSLSGLDYSIIFFIPGIKINSYIKQFKKFFFDRKILIAKEITKIHEKFIRSNIDTIEDLKGNLKGEFTVVLSPKITRKKNKNEINESVKIEIKEMFKRYRIKEVVEFISKKENLSKKIIYNFCLKLKK
jgi:16S rRNA (cytidine1402-2'-O)-methyltransferase